MVWAVVLPPTGDPEFIRHKPTYEELSSHVGGYLEAVALPNGAIGYVNEEGKLKGLPLNPRATHLAQIPGDWIAGTMVLIGPPNEEGEDTPYPSSSSTVASASDGHEDLA